MTIEDGRYTAVIDRFEDEQAVLLLEQEGTQIGELVVERDTLPENGHHIDAVLTVEIKEEELAMCQYDQTETEKRTEQTQDRFDRLSNRLVPSSEDEEADDA